MALSSAAVGPGGSWPYCIAVVTRPPWRELNSSAQTLGAIWCAVIKVNVDVDTFVRSTSGDNMMRRGGVTMQVSLSVDEREGGN